jgi:hypothetical protein
MQIHIHYVIIKRVYINIYSFYLKFEKVRNMDLDIKYREGGIGNTQCIITLKNKCKIFELINNSHDAVISFKTDSMDEFCIPIDIGYSNVLPLDTFRHIEIKIISGDNVSYKWQAYGL